MIIHVVDGTYELFSHFFGVPSRQAADGQEIAATRGVVGSMVQLLEEGATHVGVATDHVIESWRNDVYPGYKSGAGVDAALQATVPLLEEALESLGRDGVAEVIHEADDALAAAAVVAAADQRVEQVLIMTPDKDLAQCVRGDRGASRSTGGRGPPSDEAAVVESSACPPPPSPTTSPSWATAPTGSPACAGFGAKSAAAVLARYGPSSQVPPPPGRLGGSGVRGAAKLAATLPSEHGRRAAVP